MRLRRLAVKTVMEMIRCRRVLRGALSGEGGRLNVSGPDDDPENPRGRGLPRSTCRPAILSVELALSSWMLRDSPRTTR